MDLEVGKRFDRIEKKIDDLQNEFMKLFSNGPITLMSNRLAKLEAEIAAAPVCPVMEHTQILDQHSADINRIDGLIKDIKKLGFLILVPVVGLAIDLIWKVVKHVIGAP